MRELLRAGSQLISQSQIPAPTTVFEDDYSVQYPQGSGVYNFQTQGVGGVVPYYTNDGPGGSDTIFCPLPTTTAERSQLNWIDGTGFSQNQTFHNINYGYLAEVKMQAAGSSTFRLVSSHQPDGGNIPGGSSAPVGIQAHMGDDYLALVIDGTDNFSSAPKARRLNGDNSEIRPSDIVGKWVKIAIDMRGNHGTRQNTPQWQPDGTIDQNETRLDSDPASGPPVSPAGFRTGFVRIYMTIGTATTLPSDPTEADLIFTYDGWLGMEHDDGLDRFLYMKTGIYDVGNNRTDSSLTFNRVKMQDEVIVTTNPPEGFNS